MIYLGLLLALLLFKQVVRFSNRTKTSDNDSQQRYPEGADTKLKSSANDRISLEIAGVAADKSSSALGGTRPTCPNCSAQMIERVAAHGKHKGRRFWGCRYFPNCRGLVQISALAQENIRSLDSFGADSSESTKSDETGVSKLDQKERRSADLLAEQNLFLDRHKIPASRIFDATGLSRRDYSKLMSELELWVAFGVAPCKSAGHTLRTRAGNCVQCHPESLVYLVRHELDGEVYVAHSQSTGISKVGSARSATERLRNLNTHAYGGIKDWRIMYFSPTRNAGKVEYEIQRSLFQYRVARSYVTGGKRVNVQELFVHEVGAIISVAKNIIGANNCE